MTYHLLPLPFFSLLPGTGGMADLRAGVDKLPEQVQDHPRMGRPLHKGQGTHQLCHSHETISLLQGQ